jgi:endoglucanase
MNFFAAALFTMLLTGCGGCDSPSQETEQAGNEPTEQGNVSALKVAGTRLVNESGKPVVLHGVSFGWHNWWSRFYTTGATTWLAKEWHADVVRAAMGVEPQGAYLDDPDTAVRCVETVVDAAIESGIYAIIDWHSHGIRTEEAKAFFTRMAHRYKGVPNVIYEIFNEPVEDSWEQVKAYSVEVIKVIRAIDPEALILVGSPHWDQDVHIAADSPIKGYDNLMYTLHFYANTHRQELRDRGNYALDKGLPLFISECAGMEATGDGPLDLEEWGRWVEWMHERNLSWVVWSISDKDETCSMLRAGASSDGGWQPEAIKEWGQVVQQELRK